MEYLPTNVKPRYVLCGYNRIGYSILKGLSNVRKKLLIVDFNPEVISKLVKQGYHCIYGDVTDNEIIERMELKNVRILISTVPSVSDNILLIKKVREANKKAKVIVTASEIDEALKLYNLGADYVVLPHFLGGEHVANLISGVRKRELKLDEEREEHIKHLKERKNIGHEHPKHE
jgi:Trk K+ transport system NAD-binding subunit